MTAHPTPDDLALVALGEDVDAGLLEHVGECRTCFGEIDSLQQVVAVGRSLTPVDHLVAPHPRVWQRITEDVNGGRVSALRGAVALVDRPAVAPTPTTPAADGEPDELAARRRAAPRRSRWATAAVAAAAALVVGLGGGFLLKGLVEPSRAVVSSTQLNALPGWPGANGTATVENGSGGERTLVVAMDLPPTPRVNGVLEVWMSDTRAQEMLAMGTMAGSPSRFPIPAGVDIATRPIVDVSLEPSNDTDPAHSDNSVVRGRLNV